MSFPSIEIKHANITNPTKTYGNSEKEFTCISHLHVLVTERKDIQNIIVHLICVCLLL